MLNGVGANNGGRAMRASGQRGIPAVVNMEGNMTERKLPVITVATLIKSLRATAPGRIPIMPRLEGRFLESKLPIRAIATLTTVRQISQNQFDEYFRRWVGDVQAFNRVTIGFIKAQEYEPQKHAHVALIAAARLDCSHAARLWRTIAAPRYARAAEVMPYRNDIGGVGYVLKSMDACSENVEFSHNLAAFALGSGKSIFRTTSAQRRQHRRIQEQVRGHRECPGENQRVVFPWGSEW
jgi:hypothetical protein